MIRFYKFFIFFVFLITYSINLKASVYISYYYDDKFNKLITIECGDGSNLCINLCDNERLCSIKEPFCYDCVGTSYLILKDLFKEPFKLIENSFIYLNEDELLDFLKFKKFILIDYKSIFNFSSQFANESLKNDFLYLCNKNENKDFIFDEAIIVFDLNKLNFLNEPLYLICSISTEKKTMVFHLNKLF